MSISVMLRRWVIAIAVVATGCSSEVAPRPSSPVDAAVVEADSADGEPEQAEQALVAAPVEAALPTPPPCAAVGQVDERWRSRGVVETAVDLSGTWRLVEAGKGKAAAAVDFDDSEARAIELPAGPEPAFAAVTSSKRKTTVWLRRQFEVTEPGVFGLDLGSRVGSTQVYLDGKKVTVSHPRNAPIVVDALPELEAGSHVLALRLTFGRSAGGVRWRGHPRLGDVEPLQRGLMRRRFKPTGAKKPSQVVLYAPRCADLTRPRPLVVALPGWDGTVFSYAHSTLLELADAGGFYVLTVPTGGNILYTGNAEKGVLEAIDLATKELNIDTDRVTLLGVSMGGAGALQIGYHFPERFAGVVAFYGDSRYPMTGYLGRILATKANADRYSVLGFAENGRNLPTMLVHARDDKVSPFKQSQWLADEAERLGLEGLRLVAVPEGGHSVEVVESHMADAVDFLQRRRRSSDPARVSFATNSWDYTNAYWMDVVPAEEGRFGRADVSYLKATRTLTIHKLDAGLEGVRLRLDRLGMAEARRFRLRVETQLQGTVILMGLPPGATLTFETNGKTPSTRVVERGGLDLPALPPATYQVTVKRGS